MSANDLQPVKPRRRDPAGAAVQLRRRELQQDHDDAVKWLSGRGRAASLLRRLCGR